MICTVFTLLSVEFTKSTFIQSNDEWKEDEKKCSFNSNFLLICTFASNTSLVKDAWPMVKNRF